MCGKSAPGGDYFEFGRKVRQTVLQWVGIPCGVGLNFL